MLLYITARINCPFRPHGRVYPPGQIPGDGITELRGSKAATGLSGKGGPRIPDFLKLEPDEREREYARVKKEMVEALKPTPDMISKLVQNPDLVAGACRGAALACQQHRWRGCSIPCMDTMACSMVAF